MAAIWGDSRTAQLLPRRPVYRLASKEDRLSVTCQRYQQKESTFAEKDIAEYSRLRAASVRPDDSPNGHWGSRQKTDFMAYEKKEELTSGDVFILSVNFAFSHCSRVSSDVMAVVVYGI